MITADQINDRLRERWRHNASSPDAIHINPTDLTGLIERASERVSGLLTAAYWTNPYTLHAIGLIEDSGQVPGTIRFEGFLR